ncbi:MAG: hypothetical protein R3A46_15155 [Thermomicrobiales bacterium]
MDADDVLAFSTPRFEAASIDDFADPENLSNEVARTAEITQENLQPSRCSTHPRLWRASSYRDSENYADEEEGVTEDGDDLTSSLLATDFATPL